jgi:WD40 repeat protein
MRRQVSADGRRAGEGPIDRVTSIATRLGIAERPRLDPMDEPRSSPVPRIVIRQSYRCDFPVHAIAMAGWHRLISAGADNKLRVHNAETGRVLQTIDCFKRYVNAIRALDDRKVLVFFTEQYALLDLETGQVEGSESPSGARSVLAERLSPAQIVTAPMLASVTFTPPRGNQAIAEAKLDANHVVYASEDRLNYSRNQYFHLWNVPRGRETRSFWGVDSEVLSLIGLDARRVLSSHEDEYFRIWDVETSEQLRRIEHRCGKVGPMMLIDKAWLLFAPVNATEAQRLTYWHWGPSDCSLRLWDLEAGAEVDSLQCTAAITELARVDRHRFWARDEKSCLQLIEVLR